MCVCVKCVRVFVCATKTKSIRRVKKKRQWFIFGVMSILEMFFCFCFGGSSQFRPLFILPPSPSIIYYAQKEIWSADAVFAWASLFFSSSCFFFSFMIGVWTISHNNWQRNTQYCHVCQCVKLNDEEDH